MNVSLRWRMYAAAVAAGLLILACFGSVVQIAAAMRREITSATNAYIQEQQIADRLLRSVSSQLVAASSFAHHQTDGTVRTFRQAGEAAYEQIRLYLFRNLTADQRLQLEQIKEQHQYLEVAALEAFDLFARGRGDDAEISAQAMLEHALTLQRALDSFLAMRQSDLAMLGSREAAQFRYLYGGAVGAALVLLVGLLLHARFLHRRISRPLNELARAAERIGTGDLQTQVSVPHEDEFAQLAGSFNAMALQLGGMQKELVQTEKLSAMGRMMAGLAHELNGPLASILGYTELLGRIDDSSTPRPELLQEYVRPMHEEALRARALVQDFLQFSRQSDRTIAPVHLRDVLRVVGRLRSHAFEQAGLSLQLPAGDGVYVVAQQQRLQQVLINLANNALDAMRPLGRGALRVSLQPDGDFLSIHLEDDGPGLPCTDQIFEPFYTTKPVGEGTGLGLAIVHEFITDVGGSISAENRSGAGACFTIRLRTAHCADKAQGAECASVAPQPPTLSRARILVVEDEEPLRKLQVRFLERCDAQVTVACTVAEAQRIIAASEVDLIISDVKMPGGQSGVDLFQWIQAECPHLANRFLFVTGDVADPELALVAEQRPQQLVRKPFLLNEYLEHVGRLLARDERKSRWHMAA
jgi:signal transduction histidine kinase/CheY-like chemotaxis protein